MDYTGEILGKTSKEVVSFLRNSKQFSQITRIVIKILLIIIMARLSIKIVNSIIDRFVERQKKSKMNIDLVRVDTMKGLMRSLARYIIYFIAFTAIISFFGIEITGLIATAGIGGLALGFGAQNLVKDVITGFFILFEEQFGVGNYVEIDGVEGIVEEMALRVTKIRGFSGDLHIIPNGEINRVTNKSSGDMRALVEMSIDYEEDIDRAIEILEQSSEQLRAENEQITEGPNVLGVDKLKDHGVTILILAKTVPMEQWGVERLMRKTFKEALEKEGIKIPHQKMVLIKQEEKQR